MTKKNGFYDGHLEVDVVDDDDGEQDDGDDGWVDVEGMGGDWAKLWNWFKIFKTGLIFVSRNLGPML